MDVPTFVLFGVDIIRFMIDLGTFYTLYLVVSLTLNLEAGFSGVPNFGKVMFVAAGAAAAGSVSGRLAAIILGVNTHGNFIQYNLQVVTSINDKLANNFGLSMGLLLFGVLLAALVGAVLGFVASFPAVRLREDYLGMLLLAGAQLFQIFLGGYAPLIGGSEPLSVPDVFRWAETGVEVRDVVILGFLAIFAVMVYLYVERVARSPLGRTLRAVRDNEVAARALGKDDAALRRDVIIVASAISAVAGALLAFYSGSVTAETWTRVEWTFWIWVMVIIGGAGNNAGVALGAFSFTFLFRTVEQGRTYFQGYIPFDVNWLEYLMFAALLILMLAFRPGGIIAEKSTLTLPWRTVAEIVEPRRESVTDDSRSPGSPKSEKDDTSDKPG